MAYSKSIRPVIYRGHLYWQIGEVMFASFQAAVGAWSAADAHRLDLIDDLTEQRTTALAEMRRAHDFQAFSAASCKEAVLCAAIRQLRRAGELGRAGGAP